MIGLLTSVFSIKLFSESVPDLNIPTMTHVQLATYRMTDGLTFTDGLTAVKRKSMRHALVPGPGRGNFPCEILIETIAETGVRQNIIERSSEIGEILQS